MKQKYNQLKKMQAEAHIVQEYIIFYLKGILTKAVIYVRCKDLIE